MARARERGAVEIEARPEDDGRREDEREPLPAREVERREHRERDERRGEDDGDDESPAYGSDGVGGLARLGREERPVPGRLDGIEEVADADPAGVVAHGGGLGREVHGRVDAVEVVQLSLDPVRAGRARHPLEREVDALTHTGRDGRHREIIPPPGIRGYVNSMREAPTIASEPSASRTSALPLPS